MTREIDAAEEGADKGVLPLSSGSSGGGDDSFKSLLYAQLVSDSEETVLERRQRRKIGRWVALIAAAVPLLVLEILFIVIFLRPNHFSEMNYTVLIVASFSSMTVIYVFLIRGMFPDIQKKGKNDLFPVADEAMKVARSAFSGKE